MAADISPIEALGYRPTHKTVKERKAGKGKVIARLSMEQFTKDKKRTAVVLLSLAASLSVYLCIVTMLDSQAARIIVSNYMDTDMVIQNDTAIMLYLFITQKLQVVYYMIVMQVWKLLKLFVIVCFG